MIYYYKNHYFEILLLRSIIKVESHPLIYGLKITDR